jgi:Flp pilus assembly protein TadG
MLRKRASLRSERGQTMVEFTIILPIFLMLVLGVAQLGIAFNNYITITDAARAGARQGAVGRSVPDPTGTTISRVRSSAANLDQSKLGVTVTSPWTQGSDVTVTATYPYSINLLGLVVKSGQLSSSTTERVE